MRLGEVPAGRDTTMGDFATARDPVEMRELVDPLLGTLYTFLARRSQDAEEAEDLLVQTLAGARGGGAPGAGAGASLLGRLLRVADRVLRSRFGHPPLMDAGLQPSWVVPPARPPEGLLDAVAALPWEERQALGMLYGDGLPPELVGEVLNSRSPQALADRSLDAARAEWDRQLRSYARTAGAPSKRIIPDALSALRAAAVPSQAVRERVWRRVEEEREEYVSGRLLPSLPRWARPLVVGMVALLALVVGAVLLLAPPRTGSPPRPSALQRVGAPPAPPRVAVGAATAVPGIVPPTLRPGRTIYPGGVTGDPRPDSGRLFREHRGKLYYLLSISEGLVELTETDLGKLSSEGQPSTRVLLRQYELRYAVHPGSGRVVVGERATLWLQDGDRKRLLIPSGLDERPSPPRSSWGIVAAVAWHPRGNAVAAATYGRSSAGPSPTRIHVVRLGDLSREAVAALGTDEVVFSLSYDPVGRYLLANTSRGAVVVDTEKGRTTRLPAGVSRAYWSPRGPARLLWVGEWGQGGDERPFGTVEPGGGNWKGYGRASVVGWHPEGRGFIAGNVAGKLGRSLKFWRYNLDFSKEEIGEVSGIDPSVEEIAIGPDGWHLVYGNEEGLWLVHLGRGRAQRLETGLGIVTRVIWLDGARRPARER